MRKSQAVPLAMTAMVAGTITGCGDDAPADNYAVCVDPKTEIRVDDDRCRDDGGGGGYGYFYYGGINRGGYYNVPPVGGSVRGTGGTLVKPTGTTRLSGIPKSGGAVYKDAPSISRGGFGKVGGGGGRGFGG